MSPNNYTNHLHGKIDVPTLQRLAQSERVHLIDVLAGPESAPLGVPGAAPVYWKALLWHPKRRDFLNRAEMGCRLAELDSGVDSLFAVCAAVPQFAFYARWALRYAGVARVLVLEDARRLDSPLEAPSCGPQVLLGKSYPSIRVSRDTVLASIYDDQAQILDARSIEEYSGQMVGAPGFSNDGAERVGRIPRAIHVPHTTFLDAQGLVKPQRELEAEVSRLGLRPDRPVLAYCRLSHRASLVTYVLQERLGFEDVRLYDGSWTEWGSCVGLPIE